MATSVLDNEHMDAKLAEALTALCTELTNILRCFAPVTERTTLAPPHPDSAASPSVDDRPEWMTVGEVASATRVSRAMIYQMIHREELQIRPFGRLIRIHRDWLRQVPKDARPQADGRRN